MNFRYSESFDRPVEEDTKSSPKGVFLRKEIVEEQYTNPETGETKPKFVYQEAFISFEEYQAYSATKYAMENQNQQATEEAVNAAIDNYTSELIENGTI